ncbi:TetR family transcriptional regulator C-terminal domain-containing protein [Nonomuraea dietziae]|uniref:TetR family transcriptional regulator C-terminal domain-containing protein n=1 Tax=Nonomuraea dietziae TaxID=65515 RepID=UPI00360EB723
MTRGFGRLRREDLLKTACEVIAAQGFGHTRTLDIARAAGSARRCCSTTSRPRTSCSHRPWSTPPGAIWTHWPSWTARAAPLSSACATFSGSTPTGSARTWRMWIDAWAESMRSADLEETSRRLDLRWKESLRAIVDEGVASGAFACADPDAATWRILSLVDGLAVQVSVHRRVLSRHRVAELIRTATAAELGIREEDLS